MKVSLFATCLVDQLFPNVGASAARILRRLGCEVDLPRGQTCCGQPAFNSGYVDQARKVALNQLKAFAASDYVVAPSGSCTGMVRHYYGEMFADDAKLLREAASLAEKSYEFTQFVVDVLGVTDLGASCPARVTYHPSCHGSRVLGAKDQALKLLNAVRGIDIVPLLNSEDCCGFGGMFAVKLPDISAAMAAEKTDHVSETQAQILVGSDMGCLMHLGGYMKRQGSSVQVMHIAEFLDKFSSAEAVK